jgi:hypothetical protein
MALGDAAALAQSIQGDGDPTRIGIIVAFRQYRMKALLEASFFQSNQIGPRPCGHAKPCSNRSRAFANL